MTKSRKPRQHEEGWRCPECKLVRGADMHDPCLGELPGVKYACCGHGGRSGSPTVGYIYFDNGKVARFAKLTEIYDHDKCLSGEGFQHKSWQEVSNA